MIKYDDEALAESKDTIAQYGADMGGTEMLTPLKEVFDLKSKLKKRIFLLTDGYVNSGPQPVVDLIRERCSDSDDVRVFSFGIGDGCDLNLVKNAAKEGRGSHKIVSGDEISTLKAQVIDALQQASEPALTGCTFSFGKDLTSELFQPSRVVDVGNLFRNQLSTFFTVIRESDFEKICCDFSCKFDPSTKSSSSQKFEASQFSEISGTHLFKLAAQREFKAGDTLSLSLKYQVLSDATAFVGILKQTANSTEEIVHINVHKKMPKMSKMSYKSGGFSSKMKKCRSRGAPT